MTQTVTSVRHWLRRRQDLLRAIIWSALLLILAVSGCSSGGCSSTGLSLTGQEPRFTRSAASNNLVEVSSPFDLAIADAGACQRMANAFVRQGFAAIKVPDSSSAGTISRDPAHAPYVDLYPYGQPQNAVRTYLSFADEWADDIAAVLPIAPGEAAHWEVLAYSGAELYDCSQSRAGELHFTLDYSGAVCDECELEVALCANGVLTELPFPLSGQTHVLARFRTRVKVQPQQPSLLDIEGQYSEWITPGDNWPMGHTLSNNDPARTFTVDMDYYSSQGQTWMLCADWNCTQPATTLQVAPGSGREFYIKRTSPPTFDGFETLIITATAREDPAAWDTAIDNYGIAEDWTEPYDFKMLYIPALRKQ